MNFITRYVRGKPPALSRLLVACILFLLAAAGGFGFGATPAVVVGSLAGAGFSLIVNWAVVLLESEPTTLPDQIRAAATEDLIRAQHYRRNAVIRIIVKNATIKVEIETTIVPRDQICTVFHQVITPPKGTAALISKSYTVGGVEVPEGEAHDVKKKSKDLMTVNYSIDANSIEITDDHMWPAPVIGPILVVARTDDVYDVEKIGRVLAAKQRSYFKPRKTKNGMEYLGDGAFTGQKVEWVIKKRQNK